MIKITEVYSPSEEDPMVFNLLIVDVEVTLQSPQVCEPLDFNPMFKIRSKKSEGTLIYSTVWTGAVGSQSSRRDAVKQECWI